MQCSVMSSDHNSGIVKMKNSNSHKNPSKKEPNPGIIVDQPCTRLQDANDQESASRVGMPTQPVDQAEAVRRYYAAFPALKKGQESPQQYYLPPPAWCRAPADRPAMQAPADGFRSRRLAGPRERRNSHGQRRGRKRSSSRSRADLPEWVTSDPGGHWDMDAHDPVREFIRALALDEGYGTGEAPRDPAPRDPAPRARVPDCDDALEPRAPPARAPPAPPAPAPDDDELYARFEAKFDRSLEALWDTDEPPLDWRELPVDLNDLLASPAPAPAPWAAAPGWGLRRARAPTFAPEPAPYAPATAAAAMCAMETYSPFPPPEPELEPVARSYAALNHRRGWSGFAEVPPRSLPPAPLPPPPPPPAPRPADDDLLVSARTHFEPIRRAAAPAAPPSPALADGASFDIRGDYSPVQYTRSASGALYAPGEPRPYQEYHPPGSIDYARLRLTPGQRRELDHEGLRLRFRVTQRDVATQTAGPPGPGPVREAAPDALADGAQSVAGGGGGGASWARKRRPHAACAASCCPRPHARFLRCPPSERPLTR